MKPASATRLHLPAALITIALAGTGLAAVTAEDTIDQIGLHFTRTEANLAPGKVLHFHNGDDVIHNIMTINDSDMTQDYGLLKPGETVSARFENAGTYQVRCSIHPKMKMTVRVDR